MDLTLKNNREFYGKMLSIAVPVTISNLISSALSLVDNIMIGQLDAQHISATGLANQVTFILMLMFFGINSGTCIFVAQYWGNNDHASIKKVMAISYLISTSLAAVFFAVSFFFTEDIMTMLTQDAKVVELGVQYLKILAPSFLLSGLGAPILFATRSVNNARIGMYATSFSIIVNAVLNYILIFGKLGFPVLGIRGAAIATVIARVVEFATLKLLSKKYTPVLGINLRDMLTIPRELFGRVVRKALPVIANEGFWSLGMAAITVIYAKISTQASAAIFVADTVRMIFTVISFGIGNAAAVMLGNALGSGEVEKAIDFNKKFLVINVILGFIMGACLASVSSLIVNNFYNLDADASSIAITALYILSLSLPMKFYNLVTITGTFRAGGDTIFSLIIETFGVWGVGVPMTYLTGIVLGLPIPWVVVAANADELFKVIAGTPRVLSNKWARRLV